MKFMPKTLDYELSPYTGLTRENWLEAGIYMLEGIFSNIGDFQKPVVMPRKETEITNPHLKDSREAQAIQRTAEADALLLHRGPCDGQYTGSAGMRVSVRGIL